MTNVYCLKCIMSLHFTPRRRGLAASIYIFIVLFFSTTIYHNIFMTNLFDWLDFILYTARQINSDLASTFSCFSAKTSLHNYNCRASSWGWFVIIEKNEKFDFSNMAATYLSKLPNNPYSFVTIFHLETWFFLHVVSL